MEEKTCFYRRYIQGVVVQANKANVQYSSDLVYRTLANWLRKKNIRIENEMFRAVLSASNQLAQGYLSSGMVNVREACEQCRYYHTFTGTDGIHTDIKQVQKYVEDFWSILKERLDQEKALGNSNLRIRHVDVVYIGKLFDDVLEFVPEEQKKRVIALMDEFVRSELQK